jgi:DNA polymerase I
MAKERLVVIDGHAIIHRAYHAIRPLTTKDGELVNAVYGFTMILLNVLKELKPKYLAVAFDLPGKTIRHDQYEHYKANRAAAPDDLVGQFERVADVVRAFNIPIFTAEGYEADDVIGTLVHKAPKDVESVIVTGDRDELQLVDNHTKVYMMGRNGNDAVIFDEAKVIEKYGLTPVEFIDYKALRGDPSDNIPGVAGVGDVTATNLITTYGSLDNVYKNLDVIKPTIAKKLAAEKEMAYLSLKLSTIETDLPLKVDFEKAKLHDYDRAAVFTLFQELGFKSLLSRIPGEEPTPNTGQEPAPMTQKAERTHHKTAKYVCVDTVELLDSLIGKLKKQKVFAFDTETDSINQVEANLVGMSFSFKEAEAYYIPVAHTEGTQVPKDKVLKILKPILEDSSIGKVGHNIKYDYVVMKNAGVVIQNIVFDTMIAAYLVNPNARSQRLDELAFSELGLSMVKIDELIGKGKDQITFDKTNIKEASVYAAEDADITWRLYKHLQKDLERLDLAELARDIEFPLVPVLGDMELRGICLDIKKLQEGSKQTEKKIAKLHAAIIKRAGRDFNVASPAQLSEVLFDVLELHEKTEHPGEFKKLKGGRVSTNAQELAKLKGVDPIIDDIFGYRELVKLKNTYIDVLPGLVSKKDGRLHTSFNQTIAQTGRLSSSDPNLQNIPIRTESGKKIRESFVAEPGNAILSADYSQIELRVVAHIAGVKAMIKTFKEDRDIHGETAAAVYGVSQDKVTHAQRRIAKIINFGILYGVSAHGLRQQTGVSYEEAKDLIAKYFELYPEIKTYSDKMIAEAKELGYVETIFGRRRYLPEMKSSNFAVRGAAERMAINMPVQGTAADLIKLAMIDIAKGLPAFSPRTKMLLQVHDELVFEVPKAEAEKVGGFVQRKMDGVVKLTVPIETAVSSAQNWGAAK